MVGNDVSILPVGADPLNLTSSQYRMIEEFTNLAHQQVGIANLPGCAAARSPAQLCLSLRD